MVFPHGPDAPQEKKGPSPWMVCYTPGNAKVFIKKDNVLAISRGRGAAYTPLTSIHYIDDYRGQEKEVCVGVVESVADIWKKMTGEWLKGVE